MKLRGAFSGYTFRQWLFLLSTRITYSTRQAGLRGEHPTQACDRTVLVKVICKTQNENWFYLLFENVR